MKIPIISVLMPVYNGEKYLSEAIDSVLQQTFTDFEFLIINDGSTDNTEKIILDYASKDQRIKYHNNGLNLGLVKTLNKGLELANGTYIARMDADDICHTERFQRQLIFMDNNQDVVVCGTSYETFGANNTTYILPAEHEAIKAGLLFRPELCHPSVMFRKSFIEQNRIRYKAETFPAEDYKMWLDCIKIGKIHNIPVVLLYYRVHDQQITKEKHKWQKQQVRKIWLEALDYLFYDFSEKQKRFHLESFMSRPNNILREFKKHKKWGALLVLKNKEIGHFNNSALRKEIDQYLNTRLYVQLLEKFQNPGTKRFITMKKIVHLLPLLPHLKIRQVLKLLIKFTKYLCVNNCGLLKL